MGNFADMIGPIILIFGLAVIALLLTIWIRGRAIAAQNTRNTKMHTTVPSAFKLTFVGPEGPYEISFQPIDEWDGVIDVLIDNVEMRWDVCHASRDENELFTLGGMTVGSDDVWGEQYWFALHVDEQPPVIRYWGDKIVWREDRLA